MTFSASYFDFSLTIQINSSFPPNDLPPALIQRKEYQCCNDGINDMPDQAHPLYLTDDKNHLSHTEHQRHQDQRAQYPPNHAIYHARNCDRQSIYYREEFPCAMGGLSNLPIADLGVWSRILFCVMDELGFNSELCLKSVLASPLCDSAL